MNNGQIPLIQQYMPMLHPTILHYLNELQTGSSTMLNFNQRRQRAIKTGLFDKYHWLGVAMQLYRDECNINKYKEETTL